MNKRSGILLSLFALALCAGTPPGAARAEAAKTFPPPATAKASAAEAKSAALAKLLRTIFPPASTAGTPVVTVVSVAPHPLLKGSYVVLLGSTGLITDAQAAAAVKKAQEAAGPSALIVSDIQPPDPPVSLTYTLRFLRGTLPSITPAAEAGADITGIGTDKAATDLAGFLSRIYPAGDTAVTAHENRLVLVGPAAHVNALRQMLALFLDVPSAQVKADIYTIQVNTTPRNRDAAQDKIEEIAAGVQIVRDFIHGSEGTLGAYLASDQARVMFDPSETPKEANLRQHLFQKMKQAGYDPSPLRPLSLMDMLILMAVSDRTQLRRELTPHTEEDLTRSGTGTLESGLSAAQRKLPTSAKIEFLAGSLAEAGDLRLADRLEISLDRTRRQLAEGGSTSDSGYVPDAAYRRHSRNLVKLIDRIEAQVQIARQLGISVPVFSRLAQVYSPDPHTKASGMQGMCSFLDSWHDCQGAFLQQPPGGSGALAEEYPDRLSHQSAATDLLLKEAMDALTADLQALYFQPLLDWIREDVRGEHGGDSGIDLVGTTSMTIRDRTQGETLSTAESYLKFTPIPHLAPASPTAPLPAFDSALAFQALLAEDAVAPSYRKLATGTSLAIRPFVLPDGGSARVQMSLTSTVAPDQPSPGQLAQRDVPFDVISSHSVTTEATISAFDLETVSSFGVQTTGPGDYAWRVPLLDQLPLLGELFHGPRRRETKRQDSIVIVNLTILPRSLDLVPYYVQASRP